MKDAVHPHLNIPGETDHPEFFVFDFGICQDKYSGQSIPKLIELQGFPTLYGYQYFFERKIRNHFDIPDNFTTYFNEITPEKYVDMLRDVIVGEADPANVILLEIEPEKQKTRIDFAATEKLLGVREVCISDVIKHGKVLFYKRNRNSY
jgi:hypothetical protein